jgi:hypothetical protein
MVEWVPGALSPGVKSGRGVTLTTHLHHMSRSRMCRSNTPLPLAVCMAIAGQIYVLFK